MKRISFSCVWPPRKGGFFYEKGCRISRLGTLNDERCTKKKVTIGGRVNLPTETPCLYNAKKANLMDSRFHSATTVVYRAFDSLFTRDARTITIIFQNYLFFIIFAIFAVRGVDQKWSLPSLFRKHYRKQPQNFQRILFFEISDTFRSLPFLNHDIFARISQIPQD